MGQNSRPAGRPLGAEHTHIRTEYGGLQLAPTAPPPHWALLGTCGAELLVEAVLQVQLRRPGLDGLLKAKADQVASYLGCGSPLILPHTPPGWASHGDSLCCRGEGRILTNLIATYSFV